MKELVLVLAVLFGLAMVALFESWVSAWLHRPQVEIGSVVP